MVSDFPLLPGFEDFAENDKRSSTERVTKIENDYPQVRFTRRDDGSVINWGMVPEQATGTIDGNPFYYRLRHNVATLTVWDKNEVSEEYVPSYYCDSIASAIVDEVVPGDDYLGFSEDTEVFVTLLNNLSEADDQYSRFRHDAANKRILPTLSDVISEFAARRISVKVVERDDKYLTDPIGFFMLPDGHSFGLNWGVELYDRETEKLIPGLLVGVSSPEVHPVHGKRTVNAKKIGSVGSASDVVDLVFSLVADDFTGNLSFLNTEKTSVENTAIELFIKGIRTVR